MYMLLHILFWHTPCGRAAAPRKMCGRQRKASPENCLQNSLREPASFCFDEGCHAPRKCTAQAVYVKVCMNVCSGSAQACAVPARPRTPPPPRMSSWNTILSDSDWIEINLTFDLVSFWGARHLRLASCTLCFSRSHARIPKILETFPVEAKGSQITRLK